jgi:methylated-DNA-[protein]-cysteine S-methyltransferase
MDQSYYAYYHSPIGQMKITATPSVITSVMFLDKEESFRENPNSLILDCKEQLIEYFNGGRKLFNLPIEQEGTEFQKTVWSKLQEIPYGKTISYLKLALDLGDPQKVRAAAAANGKNKIAVIVPCHRVVGSNNSLVGYMGGLWRKKWLLEHELKIFYGVQTLF